MRVRGATVLELLVYMALSLVVLSAAITAFNGVRRTGASASSSFILGQDAAVSFDRLRRDFQDTSLQSIRVTPGAGQAWITMAGARDPQGKLQISPYGTPNWQNYVCYELLPSQRNDGISTLVRYEQEQTFAGHSPLPSLKPIQTASKTTPVLNQVVSPGYRLVAQADGLMALQSDAQSAEGGLIVRFVRNQVKGPSLLSKFNPNEKTDNDESGWSSGSTNMVDIQITLAEINGSTGKVSSIKLPIRVTPRN